MEPVNSTDPTTAKIEAITLGLQLTAELDNKRRVVTSDAQILVKCINNAAIDSQWRVVHVINYSGQILTYTKIAKCVTPCQNLPRQTTRPASRASSRGAVQQFPWSLLLPRIPLPRGLLYSEHSPEHHSTVPEVTSPYWDSTATQC